MPSPKNGTAGSPVTPLDPTDPTEADNSTPGQTSSVSPGSFSSSPGSYDSVTLPPYQKATYSSEPAGPSTSTSETTSAVAATTTEQTELTWIEVTLKDMDGNPVAGEPYRLICPDGESMLSGTLDEKGFIHIDNLIPGTYKITFPNRDKDAWERA